MTAEKNLGRASYAIALLTTGAPKGCMKPEMNADERRCIEVNAANHCD
jgi:hypothetical protein